MPNIIKRAIGKASSPLVKRYHVVEARKIKEQQDIYERENTPEVKAARNKAYAEATYENTKRDAIEKASYQRQGGRAGQARRGISEGLTGLSLGSANALKNDMYGVGTVDFKGMDFLTMGGSPGANTLLGIEELTGVTKRKAKMVNSVGQGQQGRGNIVINVGGSGSNKKRKAQVAYVPEKQHDWQDDIESLTGF
jgi:hypothetical protein